MFLFVCFFLFYINNNDCFLYPCSFLQTFYFFFCLLYIQLVHLSDNERKKENKEKYSLKGEETAIDDREENRKRIKKKTN